jgi:hypothetical protein
MTDGRPRDAQALALSSLSRLPRGSITEGNESIVCAEFK